MLIHTIELANYSIVSRTEKVSCSDGCVVEGDSNGRFAEAGTTSAGGVRLSPLGAGLVAAVLTGIGDADSVVDDIESIGAGTELAVAGVESAVDDVAACGIGVAGEIEPTSVGVFGWFNTESPTGATLPLGAEFATVCGR